ncbi:MAG: CpsD/CapB family tyrosine-protein kinase [Oliverpabstia sp.]
MNKLTIDEKESISQARREVFRTLRSNIEFTGVDNRAIVVTSCVPGDGKSTVSFNLARTFAESGKKTILIDADMRKSVMINRFQLEESSEELSGLSHVLSGQKSITQVIYATNVKNFYVIPSGVFPTNAPELLGTARFAELLRVNCKENFRHRSSIPRPLGNVVDAAVAAKQCDGSILVLAEGTSTRAFSKSVLNQLKTANPNVLGVCT